MSRPAGDDILSRLLDQGEESATDFVVLKALLEEASEVGAAKALRSLGLQDERARRDMDELRELLGTWRDVKRSAWKTAARWMVRVLLALLMMSMAYRLDLFNLVEP